ncbi:MAG: VWA domain-containing protein [Akkermansiaceae bacterium]|nr:VWA domain-containing protein [Verrucomicrobiales bacterium]
MANPSFRVALALGLLLSAAHAQNISSNILSPSNGGTIVRFTAAHTNIAGLIDASKRNPPPSTEGKFPQEIVFAFRDDAEVLIDRIAIKPDPRTGKTNWAKRVSVLVSAKNPLDGFEEAAVLSLEQEPAQQEVTINKRARYLKLRVIENFGGKQLNLGEVKAYEGTAPDYVSVLKRPPVSFAPRTNEAVATGLPDANENNDTPAQATKIKFGEVLHGSINPPGEFDYLSFALPGNGPRVVTMNLAGEPNIRTSVALMRGDKAVKQFDPSKAVVQRAEMSWLVEPGDYLARMTEPPISLVLIWDSSTSMRGNEQALQRGVEAFISHVKAPDRVHLIQFSAKVEPLTTNYSSDAEALQKLFKAKYKLTSGTAFLDAVLKGLDLLEGVPGNRAIVVMTDGADTQSKTATPEFWRALEEKRIRLYTIGLGTELGRFMDKTGNTARRTLGHFADATNGRFFFTEKAEQLLNLYEEISGELRSVSQYQVTFTPSSGDGSLLVNATAGRRVVTNALTPMGIIFDASGSMREKLDQRRKIDVMKQVIPQIVDSLPPQQEVAFRIYGHRFNSQEPAARTDSELVFPLARVDKEKLKATILTLSPRGTTPIAFSLQQLPQDFANVPGEKTIVLVTDGREEAGGDPVKVVGDLLASGFKFKLNVVGFALGDRESKQQMQTIAEMTGGKFYDAASAAGLRDAVERSVIEDTLSLPFALLDADGAEVVRGTTGNKPVAAPEGVFALRVDTGAKPLVIPGVRIVAKSSARVQLTREGEEFSAAVSQGQ